MFDIIKDLKENIQKNNMKKLVLSVVLGMFCYCTNNAMITSINDVLLTMLIGQTNISKAKNRIGKHKKKIYSTIKDEDEKVKKGKLLEFIKNQFTEEEQKEAEFENRIRRIEQYFHLKEKNENDECTEKNLTERFWVVAKDENEKIKEVNEEIKQYFVTIDNVESDIDDAFKEYYEAKKARKKDVENVEDVVIEEIMQECCGEKIKEDLDTRFSAKLKDLYDSAKLKDLYDEKSIIRTVKRRITLKNKITEGDLKSFIKQKIGIKEKEIYPKGNLLKEEGCCPCCDCCGKE